MACSFVMAAGPLLLVTRQLANTAGASCPTGLFTDPADILNANIAEWFGHFERIQWMLLTSPRLMKRHGEV